MSDVLGTYRREDEIHRIELVRTPSGALLLDRCGHEEPLVIAELDRDEGREQAIAVLGSGGYLRRAQAGERGLACRLDRFAPAPARFDPISWAA